MVLLGIEVGRCSDRDIGSTVKLGANSAKTAGTGNHHTAVGDITVNFHMTTEHTYPGILNHKTELLIIDRAVDKVMRTTFQIQNASIAKSAVGIAEVLPGVGDTCRVINIPT
ncbi:hypothetical protein D3C81_1033710 [compost metagenome]